MKEAGGVRKRDLADQIQEVIDSGNLRTDLEQQLDAVRNIGNFAAHTQKSTNTGAILDVEPQEAEWNLQVVAELFDHYFARPALAKARTDALNKKLKEAGKPALA